MARLKMYLVVKDTIESGFAINSTAHASLACYLKYKDDPVMIEWLEKSFSKAVVVADEEQFETLKRNFDGHVVISESALDGEEVVIAFKPRHEWPLMLKQLPLYRCACDDDR